MGLDSGFIFASQVVIFSVVNPGRKFCSFQDTLLRAADSSFVFVFCDARVGIRGAKLEFSRMLHRSQFL